MANVLVLREKSNGDFVIGMFLVDTFCLGVKNVSYNPELSQGELDELLGRFEYSTAISTTRRIISFTEPLPLPKRQALRL